MDGSNISIISMLISDIADIIMIHSECFPTSRSTKLGSPFLRRMYQWYYVYQPGLSFVATMNEMVVGFVTGAIGGGTARRRFRFAFWQIVWGFLCHPWLFLQKEMFEAWQIHIRGLFIPPSRVQKLDVGKDEIVKVTLDSIAVAPHARGRDVGKLLVSAFERAAREQGATILGLGVESDNLPARRFYEKCGWLMIRDDVGHNSANYVKDLS